MPTPGAINVLFICNDNAARSLMAEALLNAMDDGRFAAYSAGSDPTPDGQPDPRALAALAEAGLSAAGLRSKSWDEYGTLSAPRMVLVVTLCDVAAGETCPYWPGQPATAHWSHPDPRAENAQREDPAVFRHTLYAIRRHIELLVSLPEQRVDRLVLESEARRLAQA